MPKLPLEGGRQGDWPPDIIMDQAVKDLVDGKWSDYGFS